ncbi:MAG: hydantoinase/oxoprolinase family protein [Hyphomicrobiaceae bacterium]
MSWRIGIDIGGTFTDVALVEEETGKIGVAKVPTTVPDYARGVLDGLSLAMGKYSVEANNISLLSHATTVVTNAILEEKGARVALVSTRGFRDILELRRSARADLYDLFQDPPSVLVPRRRRFEITERIGAKGEIIAQLDGREVTTLIDDIRSQNVEAIAVSLLFSFLNPVHEQELGVRLRAAFPGTPVYLSSEILPEIREFERTSTTAICAYVGPTLASYVERLESALNDLSLPPLYVMGSNGGVFEAAEGRLMPAMAVESGPAAGVVAAAAAARQKCRANLLSFDMGGTTAKASMIRNGQYETTPEYEVGGGSSMNRWMNGTGHPIRVPVIDLAEVSAGGGSIAWVDRAGSLRVGPKSAGADPGPVCYRRGGTDPTVTDCNLLLGYLDSTSLLGGALSIDFDAARKMVARKIAEPLGVDVKSAAAAVIDVVNNAMAEALRIVSVQRGYDPREFSLAAFGGAGPLHATALANELGIPEVVCPPIPGAFSALGLVSTDLKRDYSRTFFVTTEAVDPADLEAAFATLEADGVAMLERAGVPTDRRQLVRAVDARYVQQSYEISVRVGPEPMSDQAVAEIAEAFHDRHRQTYGHDNRSESVQLVNVRVSAVGKLPALTMRDEPAKAGRFPQKSKRMLWFRGTGDVETSVLDRALLSAGDRVAGPAVIEALDSTVLVSPGWEATMDVDGFVLMIRV